MRVRSTTIDYATALAERLRGHVIGPDHPSMTPPAASGTG
jgi:hypothetical protein